MYAYVGNDPVNNVDPFGLTNTTFQHCTTVYGSYGDEDENGVGHTIGTSSQYCSTYTIPCYGCGAANNVYDNSAFRPDGIVQGLYDIRNAFEATYADALERQKFLDNCESKALAKLNPERREITEWYLNEGLEPPKWAAVDAIQKHSVDAVKIIRKKAALGGLTGAGGGKPARGAWGIAIGSFFGVFEYTIRSFDSAFHQASEPQQPAYTPNGGENTNQCPSYSWSQ